MRVKAFFSLNEYFLGKLSDEALSGLTEASYKAMTANGDVKLRKGWDDRLTLLPHIGKSGKSCQDLVRVNRFFGFEDAALKVPMSVSVV